MDATPPCPPHESAGYGQRHPNIAAVALANKNARIVWALLARGQEYQPHHHASMHPAA